MALRTLAHLAPGNAQAVESAARLLTDRAWPVRWAAIDAVAWLAQGGDGPTVGRAFEVLTLRLEDVDWPVRMAAAVGLNNLLQFLKAISEEFESGCQLQVGQIDDVKDRMDLIPHPLCKLLQDPAKEVKQAALDLLHLLPLLGTTLAPQSLTALTLGLRRLVEDPAAQIQQRSDALRLLGGLAMPEPQLQSFLQSCLVKDQLQEAAGKAMEMLQERQKVVFSQHF